jgi:hypothetical protein
MCSSGVRGGRYLKYDDGAIPELGFALLKEMTSRECRKGTVERLPVKCPVKCEMFP